MQSEMLAVEDAMKIEVDAVKTEPVEAEGELIGIEQTRRPKVKHGNTDESVLTRIKKEQVVNDWKNELEMQDSKVKLEGDVNYEEFKFEAEEVIIKDENDDLKEANGEIAVNSSRIKKEQVDNDWDWENELKMQDTKNELKMQDTKVKLEEDVNCEELKIEAEEVIIKEENDDFKDANGGIAVKRSLEIPSGQNQHLQTEDKLTCTLCNIAFKRKTTLDEHIVRKDPNSVSSVSSMTFECADCTYQTRLARHMLKHPEAANRYKLSICVHCNASFKNKRSLDDHMVRKHPDSLGSICTKIYECTYCTFKTVKKHGLDCHLLKHPETADIYKFSKCDHCNATFKSKRTLDDHTVRKHPDSLGSISIKIYECTHCTFKTVKKYGLSRHMLKHPETADTYMFDTCVHCNATFKSKQALDGHMLRLHPDCIGSISTKIYECTYCTFKTVKKYGLARHMLKHPETADNHKFSTCVHCNATFKSKQALDGHMLRLHPDSIGSISTEIYECTHCAFKTIQKADLVRHMLKHPKTAEMHKFSTCVHCNATLKSKRTLDDHMVRKHPYSIGSIFTKIYECTHCAFKTVKKADLDRHMSKHLETADIR